MRTSCVQKRLILPVENLGFRGRTEPWCRGSLAILVDSHYSNNCWVYGGVWQIYRTTSFCEIWVARSNKTKCGVLVTILITDESWSSGRMALLGDTETHYFLVGLKPQWLVQSMKGRTWRYSIYQLCKIWRQKFIHVAPQWCVYHVYIL